MTKALMGVSLLATLVVTGCVNPSQKIATELTRYGLDATQSQCVGDRLEANLSIGQLQELGRAARTLKTGDTTPGRLTAGDFIRVAANVRDPAITIQVAQAASSCGVIASALAPGAGR